jgi:predicted nucleotidyltransferase
MNLPKTYINDINEASKILKNEGCSEIFLFGSLATDKFSVNSDIDIAIKGCPKGKFFEILGKLINKLKHSIDLIDLDKNSKFERILREDNLLKKIDI